MKTCIDCGTKMLVDPNVILTSNPPQPKYYCPKCSGGEVEPTILTYNGICEPLEFVHTFTYSVLSFHIDGVTYTEEPLDDLTAIELYRLIKIKELATVNLYMPEKVFDKIKEYGVERHFKIKE